MAAAPYRKPSAIGRRIMIAASGAVAAGWPVVTAPAAAAATNADPAVSTAGPLAGAGGALLLGVLGLLTWRARRAGRRPESLADGRQSATDDRAAELEAWEDNGFFAPFSDMAAPRVPPTATTAEPPLREEDVPQVVEPEQVEAVRHAETHQLNLRDEQVTVQLAGVTPPLRRPWTEESPVLHPVWRSLPHDVPSDGAFVYLGAGDRGCLFVDLMRSPGPVGLAGDTHAVTGIAESMLRQLQATPGPHRPRLIVAGGLARLLPGVPEVETVETLAALRRDETSAAVLFCSANGPDGATARAMYRSEPDRRMIPVLLGDTADCPWTVTATTPRRAPVLEAVSADPRAHGEFPTESIAHPGPPTRSAHRSGIRRR